jgi:rare lipoprotein A (peptidoglycan hydrolase)
VKGRIVGLSPATADQIGLSKREGVTKVEVVPITLAPIAGSAKSDLATAHSTND